MTNALPELIPAERYMLVGGGTTAYVIVCPRCLHGKTVDAARYKDTAPFQCRECERAEIDRIAYRR